MRWQRMLGWTALSVSALVAGGVVLIGRLLPDDMCATQVFSEATSPSGSLTAVVYEIDCGATTGFSRQVALIPTPARRVTPDMLTDGFFAITVGAAVDPALPMSSSLVKLHWEAENRLDIAYPAGARLIRSADRIAMIGMSYRTYGDAPARP